MHCRTWSWGRAPTAGSFPHRPRRVRPLQRQGMLVPAEASAARRRRTKVVPRLFLPSLMHCHPGRLFCWSWADGQCAVLGGRPMRFAASNRLRRPVTDHPCNRKMATRRKHYAYPHPQRAPRGQDADRREYFRHDRDTGHDPGHPPPAHPAAEPDAHQDCH